MPRTCSPAPIASDACDPASRRTSCCSTQRTGVTSRTTSPETSSTPSSNGERSRSGARHNPAMATQKQRRRRAKEKRHDYDLVYIDEDGVEQPVERDAAPPQSTSRFGRGTPAAKTQKS